MGAVDSHDSGRVRHAVPDCPPGLADRRSAPPLEPTRFGRPLALASKLGHYILYALLLAVPCLGIIAQLKRGNPLPIFGAWDVASPWPADRATARSLREVHGLVANALLIFAGVHAVAALAHHYIFRDRTLVRMLPGGRPASAASTSAIADKLK